MYTLDSKLATAMVWFPSDLYLKRKTSQINEFISLLPPAADSRWKEFSLSDKSRGAVWTEVLLLSDQTTTSRGGEKGTEKPLVIITPGRPPLNRTSRHPWFSSGCSGREACLSSCSSLHRSSLVLVRSGFCFVLRFEMSTFRRPRSQLDIKRYLLFGPHNSSNVWIKSVSESAVDWMKWAFKEAQCSLWTSQPLDSVFSLSALLSHHHSACYTSTESAAHPFHRLKSCSFCFYSPFFKVFCHFFKYSDVFCLQVQTFELFFNEAPTTAAPTHSVIQVWQFVSRHTPTPVWESIAH